MKIAFLLLIVILSAEAQTKRRPVMAPPKPAAAPAIQAWPIASIHITGNKIYPEDAIVRASGLKLGQKAGQSDFDAARDRLLATGAFETVGYKFSPGTGGYAAVFDVTEIAQVFPYKFEALEAEEAQLKNAMQVAEPLFVSKMPGTDPVLKRFTKIVQDALAAQGKTEPIVAKLTSEPGDQLTIVFRPSRLPAVAEVKFTGNKAIDTRTLQRAVTGTAVGSIFSEKRFQEILDIAIRPLYEAQGRVRVRFLKLSAEPAKDVRGLAVNILVEEGEVYNLGYVAVTGVSNDREMAKEAGLKSEEPFNGATVQEGVTRIKRRMQNNGYIDVVTDVERKIDDAKKVVDLKINVTPGPLYSFGKLTINGLNIQTEPQIRKLWTMKSGQAFNAGYPDLFLTRLREEGIFENLGETKSERKVDEKERIVDVALYFSTDGKPLPAIGAARDEQEREERRKKQYPPK